MTRRFVSIAAVAMLGLTACGRGASTQAPLEAPPAPPTEAATKVPATAVASGEGRAAHATSLPDPVVWTVAEATVPSLPIWQSPANPKPAMHLPNPRPSGAPLVLLAADWQQGWLEVLLPVRPNGSRGWVRQDDVTLTQHDWWIEVSLQSHRLVAWKGDSVVLDEAVGVGRNATPTPTGVYYTTELLRPPNPNGPYGHYAFGLSGYSDVLMSFKGGPGEVGLHGTNNPRSVGRDVSSGCLRVTNDAISKLAGELPLGAPVFINE